MSRARKKAGPSKGRLSVVGVAVGVAVVAVGLLAGFSLERLYQTAPFLDARASIDAHSVD